MEFDSSAIDVGGVSWGQRVLQNRSACKRHLVPINKLSASCHSKEGLGDLAAMPLPFQVGM